MAFSFDGITSKLSLGTALITAVPFTVACFFKESTVAIKTMFTADNANITNRFVLSSSTGGIIQALTTNTTNASATTTETYADNMWNSAAMVSGSATSRYAVLNGRFSVVNSTSKTPTGISTFIIGNSSAGTSSWDGLLAEFAVWQAALTPRELQSYNSGVPASLIRPENLILYMPLTQQVGVKDFGPQSLILANTAAVPVSDHPLILKPSKPRLRRVRLVY